MHLKDLLKDFFPLPDQANRDILQLTLDSRNIKPHDLFLALPGTKGDGRQYINAAINQGAAAILVPALPNETLHWQNEVPIIPIPQLPLITAALAARFYKHPANKLRLIGVTGTNGKTSVTHFMAQLLTTLAMPAAIIGTLGSGRYGALGEPGLTTPDPITLQALLKQFVSQGVKAVAMEVSSHSIDQERIRDLIFEIAIFTNLTQDHLDYHGDMQTYANVKRRFLADTASKQLIINYDDTYGATWLAELATVKPVYGYGFTRLPSHLAHIPYVFAQDPKITAQGMCAKLQTPWGEGELTVPLLGLFNVSNALAVLSALCVLGLPFEKVITRLASLQAVPGRMQWLGGFDKPIMVVDYAHTPDALEKVLQALRANVTGKLYCVFGCGGDRDHGKRPLMASIAERIADHVIVTSDNPRTEAPEAIIADILTGFTHPNRVMVEPDRSKAIEKSIQCAVAGDVVLIAGKGAEHYQIIGNQKMVFDDVAEVTKYLNVI